jgi:hypothetical protein
MIDRAMVVRLPADATALELVDICARLKGSRWLLRVRDRLISPVHVAQARFPQDAAARELIMARATERACVS